MAVQYWNFIQDTDGTPIGDATITVYAADGVTLAPIFSDEAGTISKINPFYSDSLTGEVSFFADNGEYWLGILAVGYNGDTEKRVSLDLWDVDTVATLETTVIDAAASATASATSASDSATAAANSASSASTSAGNAATSASNAATSEANALSSANNAATSESNAATSESNTATSESNALVYSNNAATSASNAATSETNAATSAAEAAASATIAVVNNAVISEADFMARAAANRDKFAGSGFIEFGKVYEPYIPINEGLSPVGNPVATPKILWMGRIRTDAYGNSKTGYPISNVNGVPLKLLGTKASGVTSLDANRCVQIDFPPAPIATNLITNGTFDTDTSGWNYTATRGTLSWETSGSAKLTNDQADSYPFMQQSFTTTVGKKYRVSVQIDVGTATNVKFGVVSDAEVYSEFLTTSGVYSCDFIADASSSTVNLYVFETGNTGNYAIFDNISVIDLGKVERQDLVFLESWHEKIADKDIVYPYGNVQSLLATDPGSGLATINGSFTGYGTYSLFGNWQADSDLIGKGLVWSTMSDTNRKKFVSDPENNIYLAEDGELVQVRYRIRVVEGLGADWTAVQASSDSIMSDSVLNRVSVKASAVSISADTSGGALPYYTRLTAAPPDAGMPDIGSYGGRSSTSLAYKSLCFATPIVLVSRRNQGAYHPVWNPSGTAWLNASSTTVVKWYEGTCIDPTSTADCFSFSTNYNDTTSVFAYSASGAIADALASGRPDGKLYDAIYEGDVLDLRNSSHKQDLQRVLERELNKDITGETRGWENSLNDSVPVVVSFQSPAVQSNLILVYSTTDFRTITNYSNLYLFGKYKLNTAGVNANGFFAYFAYTSIPNTTVFTGISIGDTLLLTRKIAIASKELLYCDLIGDPANYPSEWLTNGVAGNQLLVGEKGENLIPDGTVKTYKLSRKVKDPTTAGKSLVLYSDDAGVTWAGGTTIAGFSGKWNATTNAFVSYSPAATRLFMVFYTTEADPFETADNAEVLTLGGVFAGNYGGVPAMARLVSHLINKVPINTSVYSWRGRLATDSLNALDSKLSSSVDLSSNAHEIISLGASNPAVKVLSYLTRKNGKLYLQLLFKEMKYATTWGDDSKFDVVNGISTTTDDNGNTVLIGQKRLELPYFIGDGE